MNIGTKMIRLFYLSILASGLLVSTASHSQEHTSNLAQPKSIHLDPYLRRIQLEGVISHIAIKCLKFMWNKKVCDLLPNASSQTADFVKSIGDEYGITDDYSVKLGAPGVYAANNEMIIVEQGWPRQFSSSSSIDQTLDILEDPIDDEEKEFALAQLDECTGILDHEFGHYKNNDVRNMHLAPCAFSIAAATGYLLFEHYCLSKTIAKLNDNQKKMYSYASGIGLSLANVFFDLWYQNRCEKRADEHVRTKAPILKAMIAWSQRLQNQVKAQLQTTWFGKKFAHALEKYPSLYYLLDPVHPPLPYREARFKERLAELEKAEEKAAIVNS